MGIGGLEEDIEILHGTPSPNLAKIGRKNRINHQGLTAKFTERNKGKLRVAVCYAVDAGGNPGPFALLVVEVCSDPCLLRQHINILGRNRILL